MALFPWLGSQQDPQPEKSQYTPAKQQEYRKALASGDNAAAKKIERNVNKNGTKKDRVQLQADFQNGYRR